MGKFFTFYLELLYYLYCMENKDIKYIKKHIERLLDTDKTRRELLEIISTDKLYHHQTLLINPLDNILENMSLTAIDKITLLRDIHKIHAKVIQMYSDFNNKLLERD